MNSIFKLVTLLLFLCLQGCTAGDMRAFNDALATANGQSFYYPNNSETNYVGDVEWTTGVWNNEGYQIIDNTSDEYCKVRVKYENDSYDFFYMAPYESTDEVYTSIYNWPVEMETICGSSRDVFSYSF